MANVFPRCNRSDCFGNKFMDGFNRCTCLSNNSFDGECPFYKTKNEFLDGLLDAADNLQSKGHDSFAAENRTMAANFMEKGTID